MRKARAETAAASKPRGRARAKPKPTPSPAASRSPSGGSSPSLGLGASPAADLAFHSPSSPATPKPRSPLAAAASSPFAVSAASLSTVRDLRSLATSSLDSLKRRLDALHGDSLRDVEASYSRISKRLKMQTQSCTQLAEEAGREHRKMADKVAERADAIKMSYKKFVAEAQSSTSRVCKVTIPEMAKSVERAIDGLRSRYNIPATPA